jgi:hypothetical protein
VIRGQSRHKRNGYPFVTRDVRRSSERDPRKNPLTERAYPKRLMGLEPTTFCMAIVCVFRINAYFCGFRLNPITVDYRGFSRYWSPNGPPGDPVRCNAPDESPCAVALVVT